LLRRVTRSALPKELPNTKEGALMKQKAIRISPWAPPDHRSGEMAAVTIGGLFMLDLGVLRARLVRRLRRVPLQQAPASRRGSVPDRYRDDDAARADVDGRRHGRTGRLRCGYRLPPRLPHPRPARRRPRLRPVGAWPNGRNRPSRDLRACSRMHADVGDAIVRAHSGDHRQRRSPPFAGRLGARSAGLEPATF
jgi:hypothetical protein